MVKNIKVTERKKKKKGDERFLQVREETEFMFW